MLLRSSRPLVVALVVCVAAACGRVDFDPLADAAGDSGLPVACGLADPFGPPTLVDGLTSADADVTLRLQSDELTGMFWSTRSGDAVIYAAQRADLASPFTVSPIAELDLADTLDVDPTLSPDGSFVVFGSIRPGGAGGFDLWESLRTGTTYGPPGALLSLDTAAAETQPNWSPAEFALYFASDRGGGSHLYKATRTGPMTYAPPVAITELNADGDDYDPVPSADGLTIYFRSSRVGNIGGGDIYVATRSSLSQPFGAITRLLDLNSPVIDGSSHVSSDGCRLYFTSDRSGMPKIYVAHRMP